MSTAPDAPNKTIPASPDDIPLQTAIEAHKGTSWTPERRGESEQQQYMQHMESVWEELVKLAKTPEQEEIMRQGLEEYRWGYARRYTAYLSVRSRVLSPMIAGPAGFASAQNRKRSEAADRRGNEVVEWSEKKLREIRKRIRPDLGPISADQENAPELLREKIGEREAFHGTMKKANKIIRKTDMGGEEVRAALLALGLKEKTVHEILFPRGDFFCKAGFPSYVLASNRNKIERLRKRLEHIEETRERPVLDGFGFETGIIEEDPGANRLRIFFDAKPGEEIRGKLKQNGFRWAPSIGAWQRRRGEAAFRAAEGALGIEIPRPGTEED